ncbi:hypothetical protein Tco_0718471 [Tanacetum coccineum]
MLLKLVDDLQILKGSRQEKKETTAQSFTPYWNFSMIDDEEARENFMKDICTFLRKFSRISFGVTPKVILIAWERFGKIKDALSDKHYQQEDIQELMSKLLEDVRNIREELSKYINFPSWNRLTFYDNDDDDEYTSIYRKPTAITPDLPIEEPDNSLIMGDEHLNTILSVENIVPIPSEFEGISEDTCDVPVYEDSSTFEALSDHSEILSDSNNVGTSSDDDPYENIEYVEALPLNLEIVSLEEVNKDQEEKEFDLEDIFQIQDVILREKLVNISRLITNIESLKDNPTPDRVLKSPSSFLILVTDSNSFFEKSDTSFSFSDNSLPEFETFSDHTEETRSGSTTTHANNSLSEGGEINVSQNVEKEDPSHCHSNLFYLPSYPADSPLIVSTGVKYGGDSLTLRTMYSFSMGESSDLIVPAAVVFMLSVRENSRRTKNDRVKYEWDAKQGLVGNLKSSFRANVAGDRGGESVDTTAVVKDAGKRKMTRMMMLLLPKTYNPHSPVDLHVTRNLVSILVMTTMAPTRRSQTNPPPPLTQEAGDQLVRNRIKAAIRVERERVKEEATRAGGPAGGPVAQECTLTGFMKCGPT